MYFDTSHSGDKPIGVRGQGYWWRWAWQLSNVVMFVFLVLAAAVNINDPDPYIWMSLYGVAALLVLPIVFKPSITENVIWKYTCVLHIVLCAVGAVYSLVLVIDLELKHSTTSGWLEREEAREFVGALITAVWLLICRCSAFGSESERFTLLTVILLVLAGITSILPILVWSLCLLPNSTLHHCGNMISANSKEL